MRRILPLLLVAAIAFTAGTAGANGTLSRLLAEAGVHIGALPTPTSTAAATPSATATTGTSIGVVSTVVLQHAPSTTPAPSSTGTPLPSSTPRPSSTPLPSSTPTATRIPPPPAPLSLEQRSPDGTILAADGWTGMAGLTLHVLAPAIAGDTRAEVEVRPLGEAFRGAATAAAPVVQGVAGIPLHGLASGHYHWQARLTSATGNGVWTAFAHDGTAFGVQLSPPPAPLVSSPTNPRPDTTYATRVSTFTWTAPHDPSGIAGYSYRLDKDAKGEAPRVKRTQAQEASLGGLDTGAYYFHLRAVDGVGNWGRSVTLPIKVDVTAPRLINTNFSGPYLNPSLESLTLNYQLTKVATVTIGIYAAPDYSVRIRHIVPKALMPAGQPLSISWDGRDDAGHVVPPGWYGVWLKATDRLGNANSVAWGHFRVTDKKIVVSLTQQRLWAFQGDQQILTTLVTTGNKLLPTPTGLFHILFAKHPFTFISPWPKGSPFYYKPSPVEYALYFRDYGFYIHDAPWRGTFGPGSNLASGTPGSNDTGTHGCVNVPAPVMAQLYRWAITGTAVQITP